MEVNKTKKYLVLTNYGKIDQWRSSVELTPLVANSDEEAQGKFEEMLKARKEMEAEGLQTFHESATLVQVIET